MPARNSLKIYGEEQYYHIYNRGAGKQAIFLSPDDYVFMLGLFKKHLSEEEVVDRFGRTAPNYKDKVELVAYCLMPNHYHLLVYLKEVDGVERLMRSIMTTYSMYFNRKYERSGTLFQGPFKASRITNEAYFWHISRYIHLNPLDIGDGNYRTYPYSSIGYFDGNKHADWLHEERQVITDDERRDYADFVADYEDYHDTLERIKPELVN